MAQIRFRAHLEPVVTPSRSAETRADQTLLERIYAPLVTTWIGRTERFFAESTMLDVDSLTLCMDKGKAYLEADLKMFVTEASTAFIQFQAWSAEAGQTGKAPVDHAAAKKGVLEWVETQVQACAVEAGLCLNMSADDLIFTGAEGAT